LKEKGKVLKIEEIDFPNKTGVWYE